MNIEEAKKLIDKQSIGKGGVGDIPVVKTHIVKVLLDQLIQPKPEVPQFVADWYEENKYDFYLNLHKLAWELIENLDEDCFVLEKAIDSDFKRWYYRNKTAIKTLINMHQLGYTVEKEKLYTVEIPNPNRNSKGCAKFRLEKLGDKVYLVKRKSKDVYQNKDSQKLTESEIRKDFDWAWQFREEVAE
ncbi:TPA: DUF1642 domain-containing protein [Streptococcus agalactiae]|nr:DUF1642 domain-containing protein [Streptococcus agalactiae]